VEENADELSLSTQWIYDIMQEFIYQFQGFCQLRSNSATFFQHSSLLLDDAVWNLSTVYSILNKLIALAQRKNVKEQQLASTQSSFQTQFGYFAGIELSRLECLLGNFSASLQAISGYKLADRSELFFSVPLCQFNVFYHYGVSNMMTKHYTLALDSFAEIILSIARILKIGFAAVVASTTNNNNNLKYGHSVQLQKMFDKVLSLTAILTTVFPYFRIDNQVKEILDARFSDKLWTLKNGNMTIFRETLEVASPKFVSSTAIAAAVVGACEEKKEVAAFDSTIENSVFSSVTNSFVNEIEEYFSFLKLRSYLILYSTIDIAKLARFIEVDEKTLIEKLALFKSKISELKIEKNIFDTSRETVLLFEANFSNSSTSAVDVEFDIVDDKLYITNTAYFKSNHDKSFDNYFITGIKKHNEIIKNIHRTFYENGL
jgi:translation initiation factor 3 subunit L